MSMSTFQVMQMILARAGIPARAASAPQIAEAAFNAEQLITEFNRGLEKFAADLPTAIDFSDDYVRSSVPATKRRVVTKGRPITKADSYEDPIPF